MKNLSFTNNENFLINFISYLVILLPFFLISGPFLSDLAISMVSLIFIYFIFKKKLFYVLNNFYFKIFILFYVYIVLNSFFININFDSLKISIFYFRFGFFVLALIFILENKGNFLRSFLISLVLAYIILILDGYFEYFNGSNIIGLKTLTHNRIGSFFGEEAILGSYLSRMFPILFALYIFFRKSFKNQFLDYFFFIIFILTETLIFLSGERTAFFLFNISTFYIIILSPSMRYLKISILIFSICLISFITIFNSSAKHRIFDRTLHQLTEKNEAINSQIYDTFQNTNIKYIFSRQHHEHYLSAFNIFLDNKFYGIGVKNFRKICKEQKYNYSKLTCSTHPHNIYLQLLSETGLFGFLYIFSSLILIIFFSIKQLVYNFNDKKFLDDFQICILSSFIITLFPIAPTGNFFNNWLSIVYYLPVGFFIWYKKIKPNF